MKRFLIVITALIFALSACTGPSNVDKIPDNVKVFSQNFIHNLANGEADSVLLKCMNDTVFNRDSVLSMPKKLDHKKIDSLELKFFGQHEGPEDDTNDTYYNVIWEGTNGDKYISISLIFAEKDEELKVLLGIIQVFDAPMAEINELTLNGKSGVHYLFLLFMAIIPLAILYTVYRIYKDKSKNLWLWMFGSIIGLTRISLEWTTGFVSFNMMDLVPGGVNISQDFPDGNWRLFVGLPLIAGLWWFKYYQKKNAPEEAIVEDKQDTGETKQKSQTTQGDYDPWNE